MGQSGLYADVANAQFDDYLAVDGTARDPLARHFVGSANAWVASYALNVDEEGGGEVWVQGFADDDYMFQADVKLNDGDTADVWMRYQDSNNGYCFRLDDAANMQLFKVEKGKYTSLALETVTTGATVAVKIKVDGTTLKAWVAGTWGNLLMAASIMAIAPVALLFAIFNRHITAGLHLPRY